MKTERLIAARAAGIARIVLSVDVVLLAVLLAITAWVTRY